MTTSSPDDGKFVEYRVGRGRVIQVFHYACPSRQHFYADPDAADHCCSVAPMAVEPLKATAREVKLGGKWRQRLLFDEDA